MGQVTRFYIGDHDETFCWLTYSANLQMSKRKVIFNSEDEPGQKKILHDAVEDIMKRIGKWNTPVAIVRPYCPRRIGGIPADELERIRGPLEIEFPDSEESQEEDEIEVVPSDEENDWETTLPDILDINDLPQLDRDPEYLNSEPLYSDSEVKYELWRWGSNSPRYRRRGIGRVLMIPPGNYWNSMPDILSVAMVL